MATVDISVVDLEKSPGIAYVGELTAGLIAAGLDVAYEVHDGLATLTVANPAVSLPGQSLSLLTEKVSLRRPCGGDQWQLYWSWGEVLGPADHVSDAVAALTRVLAHLPAEA